MRSRIVPRALIAAVTALLLATLFAPSAAATPSPCSPDTGVRGGVLVGFGYMDVIVESRYIPVLPATVYVPGTPGTPAVRTPTVTTPPIVAPGIPPYPVVIPGTPAVDRPATPAVGVPGFGVGSAEVGSGDVVVRTPGVVINGVPLVPASPGGNVVPARPPQTILPAGTPTTLAPSQTIPGQEIVPARPGTPGHYETIGGDQPTWVRTPRAWVYDLPYPCYRIEPGRGPPVVEIGQLPDRVPSAGVA